MGDRNGPEHANVTTFISGLSNLVFSRLFKSLFIQINNTFLPTFASLMADSIARNVLPVPALPSKMTLLLPDNVSNARNCSDPNSDNKCTTLG